MHHFTNSQSVPAPKGTLSILKGYLSDNKHAEENSCNIFGNKQSSSCVTTFRTIADKPDKRYRGTNWDQATTQYKESDVTREKKAAVTE